MAQQIVLVEIENIFCNFFIGLLVGAGDVHTCVCDVMYTVATASQ